MQRLQTQQTAGLDMDSLMDDTGEGGDRSSLKMEKGIDSKKLNRAPSSGGGVIGQRRLSQLGGIQPKPGLGGKGL